jgi:UDP-2-acetamido-2-deoxy-ribo-hexuluronate aminotransferase
MKTIPFIDLREQYLAIKPHIHERIKKVLDHGQYIMGPEVIELEDKLSKFTGNKHCITVSSGTDALLISLMALDVGPGDEVITTPFSFVATAEVIVLLGATPIFVDIDADTCNINAKLIEKNITKSTKAIIPVSLYGQPANMDEINAVASNYPGVTVIEDAAQSFGSTYKGKKSCNLSTIGCTSFFPSKPLGCYGDGGAIFTNNDNIAKLCREIRVHGQSERYVHTRVGIGGRMDTIQCAIVLAKLDHFEPELNRRYHVAEIYMHQLSKSKISFIRPQEDRTSVFAQFTICVEDRERIQKELVSVGVPTTVHYPLPLNEQPAYKYLGQSNSTPTAKLMAKQVMSLPMGPYLKETDQKYIIKKLIEIYKS